MNLPNTQEGRKTIILYFQIHQPRRLRSFSYFDIGEAAPYFDDELNKKIVKRIAAECYLPANDILLQAIRKNPEVRVSFSITGSALEQFQAYAPEVIESFKALVATGSVEMIAETYYHSLASVFSGEEFEKQVTLHIQKINDVFGITPVTFRNTELIYNNDIGKRVSTMGFHSMLIEGVENTLHGQSVYNVYTPPSDDHLCLLARSCGLSDDIGFRFERPGSSLTATEYCSWLRQIPEAEAIVTLGLDYETFGEHKKANTGVLQFLNELVDCISSDAAFKMKTPAQIVPATQAAVLDVPGFSSWADHEKDLSAWLGNAMQQEAFALLQKNMHLIEGANDEGLLTTWRWLQASDHLYYISTKKFADGEVHSYFSPYSSPYEAFINYMNVLSDFEMKVEARIEELKLDNADAATVNESERREHLPEPVWVENIKVDYKQHQQA